MITLVTNVEMVIGAVLILAFIVAVLSRSDWKRHPVGVFLVTFMSILEVLLAMRIFARVVTPIPDQYWAGGFAVMDAVLAWLLWLLWRAQDSPNIFGGMMSRRFFREMIEFSLKAAAVGLTVNGLASAGNLIDAGWKSVLTTAGAFFVAGVIASVMSAPFGDRNSVSVLTSDD